MATTPREEIALVGLQGWEAVMVAYGGLAVMLGGPGGAVAVAPWIGGPVVAAVVVLGLARAT